MADPNWEEFAIQLPGQDLLEPARNVLETLLIFLEVLKAILETVKAFLIDFGNPIKALVEALIRLILALFEALKRTGVYGYFDIPDPLRDPNFEGHIGGYQAFTARFKGSLNDHRDPNRPQPITGFTKSGFTLIVADADGPDELIRLIQTLLKFFGKEFLNPQYAAPANFKVLPLGDAGDPILSITRLFEEQPESVVASWALPPTGRSGDPGFSDIVSAFSTEFYPPKFLIEKSSIDPSSQEIDIGGVSDPEATGRVTAVLPTDFEIKGAPGQTINRKVQLFDTYGDPLIKFQEYIVIDLASAPSTFLLGQLGTFRYIDDDVEVDKTYFYRVRAFSGDLAVSGDKQVDFKVKTDVVEGQKVVKVEWSGTSPASPPVMGRATAITRARIPKFPADFDVLENLRRIFQCGYSFNFHQPLPEGAEFDKNGVNVEPTKASDIGKGSMDKFAGPLAAFEAIPVVGGAINAFVAPDPVTGQGGELPWMRSLTQRSSNRLATIVAGALLEAGGAEGFKSLMQGSLPAGPISVNAALSATTTLEQVVFKITEVQDANLAGQGGVHDAAVVYGGVAGAPGAFTDPATRLNVLAAVNFIKSFTLGGTPPDWIQISILRDIIPWSGQLLYELLAKMQALLDAYKGVIDEIKAFIDLIIRKIETLERLLQYLIALLDFIESLSVGFFILSVPETEGDSAEWARLIDNAGGNPPPSGPGGYSAGVGLAYVAIDIGPFAEAFKLIF